MFFIAQRTKRLAHEKKQSFALLARELSINGQYNSFVATLSCAPFSHLQGAA